MWLEYKELYRNLDSYLHLQYYSQLYIEYCGSKNIELVQQKL